MLSGGRDRVLWLIGAVALVLLLIFFVRENDQIVRVDFMLGTIETDLGIAVVLAALAGFVVGRVAGR